MDAKRITDNKAIYQIDGVRYIVSSHYDGEETARDKIQRLIRYDIENQEKA